MQTKLGEVHLRVKHESSILFAFQLTISSSVISLYLVTNKHPKKNSVLMLGWLIQGIQSNHGYASADQYNN